MNPDWIESLTVGAVFKESEVPCVGMCFSADGMCLTGLSQYSRRKFSWSGIRRWAGSCS